MAWKNVKEHYRIGHQVQITDKGICIGSQFVHDLIVIGLDGKLTTRANVSRNDDLCRYLREMDADPEKLRQLVQSPDSFAASVTVYTYAGGEIIETRCETPGWPNVTHDGAMMYANTFSTDKDKVVRWAKEYADIGIKRTRELIQEAEELLAKRRSQLVTMEAHLAQLEAAYPGNSSPVGVTESKLT